MSVTTGEVRVVDGARRDASRAAVRRVVRRDRDACSEHPEWQAAMRRRGHRRLRRWCRSTRGRPARSASTHEEGRRISRCISYLRESKDRQRLRPPDRRRHRVLRPGRAARCSRCVDLGVVPLPAERALVPPRRRRTDAHRPEAARDRATRGPELHGRRQPRALAARGRSASASTRTRASCSTQVSYHDGDRRPAGAAPSVDHARWSCPTATPAPMHGWKNAFDAGEWGLGRMANSLKLGCDCLGVDPLLRRGARHRAGRPVHRRARDLHARGGLRDPLEAPRPARRHRRGAPVASPRRQLHRHRRQLRVRLLLVPLPRREHPARGEAHGHHLADGDRSRARCPSSPNVDRARARGAATTSTCSRRASTSTSTAPTNTVYEVEAEPRAGRARQPVGERVPPARRRASTRERGARREIERRRRAARGRS